MERKFQGLNIKKKKSENPDFAFEEALLEDEKLIETYKTAVLENKTLFRNKIVLEIGCGTGIFSMFAIKAGALSVFAIDTGDMAMHAKKTITDNRLDDKICVYSGPIENILLPCKVDIIISFWMGYCVFYNSLLDQVIYARDNWLKEGGKILPDKVGLFLCGFEDQKYHDKVKNSLSNVYGFDMSCVFGPNMSIPIVDLLEEAQVVTNSVLVKEIDVYIATKDDCDFKNLIYLMAMKDDYIHGFCLYFKVFFSETKPCVSFSTAPDSGYDFWSQTLFYLEEEILVKKNEAITGTFAMRPCAKTKCQFDFTLDIHFDGDICQYHNLSNYRFT